MFFACICIGVPQNATGSDSEAAIEGESLSGATIAIIVESFIIFVLLTCLCCTWCICSCYIHRSKK